MNGPLPLLNLPQPSTSALEQAAPEETGTSGRLLEEAHQAVLRQYPRMRSMLVFRRGRLIFERYYDGSHAGTLHDLRSATKSFVGLLIGIALGRGELAGLDLRLTEGLAAHVPQRPSPGLEQLTLRHLLTMTSGFRWITGKKLGEPLVRQMQRSRRWAAFALGLPVDPEQIGKFQYRSSDSHLLSVLLSEATGMNAFAYAREHLFGPLDIRHLAWHSCPEGHTMGHIGLYLTARDFGKVGLCLLGGGTFRGRTVLPGAWLNEALAAQTAGYPAYGDYGYQFWCGRICGKPFTLAHGHGGQQLWLLTEQDAAVVFTADSAVNRWKSPRPLLERYILPALQEGTRT